MTRWEYLVVGEPGITRESLNELGADGWELIGIGLGLLVFKRPID